MFFQSQLRNRLITELKQIGVSQDFGREARTEDGSLLHRAADSLVADHLRRCHYDYSLSVFLPECGIPQDKVLLCFDTVKIKRTKCHTSGHQTKHELPSIKFIKCNLVVPVSIPICVYSLYACVATMA